MYKDEHTTIEKFKELIKETFFNAKMAHDFLLENLCSSKKSSSSKSSSSRECEFISCILLNNAISSYTCCRSFYYSNIEFLEDTRADLFLHKFKTFSNEFLENVKTNHSHQWTNLTFEELKDQAETILGDLT